METKIVILENIELVIPKVLKLPWEAIDSFPASCGAGSGFGVEIVPETIWGLRISPCCWVHDESWKIAEATWADFHQTNAMFLTNTLKMIQARRSKLWFINGMRVYRAATYYNAVSIVGAPFFWAVKKKEEQS